MALLEIDARQRSTDSAERWPLVVFDVPLSFSLNASRFTEVWKVAVGLYTALEADRSDPSDRTRNVILSGRAVERS